MTFISITAILSRWFFTIFRKSIRYPWTPTSPSSALMTVMLAFSDSGLPKLTFTGIQVINPHVLE